MASRMDFSEGDDGTQSSSSHCPSGPVENLHDDISSHLPVGTSKSHSFAETSGTGEEKVLCPSPLAIDNTVHEEKKSSVARDLFPLNKNKRVGSFADLKEQKKQAVIPFKGSLSSYIPPLLSISEIADSKVRFAIEGKILSKYGTYRTSKDFKKYLKVDLVDREGFQTITLVVGEPHISKYETKLELDTFVRVEGSVVIDKNAADGGSAKYSLHVDATTSIIKAEPFDVTLVFMPEISIQNFIAKSLGDSSIKGTLAFVVLQVDRAKKSGVFDQLTIADGPNVTDRATLSFINGRKADFNKLVEEFEGGNVVMYIARNVGVWKDKSNTLSIFDITILTPVFGDRLRSLLLSTFHSQIHEMGYGQEVDGAFTVSNFNGALVIKKCSLCKESKINQISEGGYCFACGKVVDISLCPIVEGVITHAHSGVITNVRLSIGIVDRVLQFQDTFINLYHQNPILLRVALSEVEVFGKFFVDNKAQVVSYNANVSQ